MMAQWTTLAKHAPLAAGLVAAVSLALWLFGPEPDFGFAPRVETEDDFRSADESAAEPVDLTGELTPGPGLPGAAGGAWPQFRGPARDNIAPTGSARLARSWPDSGPPRLWSADVGEGYAGAAIRDGRVYVLDYDMERRGDVLRCLSLDDGREIWRRFYAVDIRRNHGMSRTVPALAERYVVALGPKSHVTCLDAETGAFYWGLDLERDHGAETPPWYAGQCPLVDGDRVILAPGGPDALLMAVSLETGAILWRTPNPRLWRMTHSSVVETEADGVRMFVYCASGGVVGVAADDGRLLWEYDGWRIGIANVPTPVPAGDGRLFLSGGYNAGAMMLQVRRDGDAFVAEPLYRLRPTVSGSVNQTPILYGDHIYHVIPNGQLACLDLDGATVWTSGSEHRFGIGPYLIADGLILLLDDHAVLTAVEATPDAFRIVAQARVLDDGHEAWAPMALADGILVLRDFTRMVALDLTARQASVR